MKFCTEVGGPDINTYAKYTDYRFMGLGTAGGEVNFPLELTRFRLYKTYWDYHSAGDLGFKKCLRKSLDFAVTRFLMKLFRTSNTEIIAECQHYFGFSLPSKLIERKKNKFVNNYKYVSLL